MAGDDECTGRAGEDLRSGVVAHAGMVVAVLERSLLWLACARGTRAEALRR